MMWSSVRWCGVKQCGVMWCGVGVVVVLVSDGGWANGGYTSLWWSFVVILWFVVTLLFVVRLWFGLS